MNGVSKKPEKGYGPRKEAGVVFRWSGVTLAKYTIPLPTFAFIVCVLISLYKDFDRSTATHCKVPNYLPSISAAIGSYSPQIYIWRVCIALHSTPRLMIAVMYYRYFMAFPVYAWSGLYQKLCALNTFLHLMENFSLIGLSYVSSTENYQIHEKCFIFFMIFSQFYMLLTIILSLWARKNTEWTSKDLRSFRWKVILFITNISFFFFAIYLFVRHNRYCEPGVYTVFAFCEYGTIATNIGYNATWFLIDFRDADYIVHMSHQGELIATTQSSAQTDRGEGVRSTRTERGEGVHSLEPHPWTPVLTTSKQKAI